MKRLLIITFFLFTGLTPQTLAQTPAEKILRRKAETKLQKIIDHSSAITGLVAVDLTTSKTTFSFNSDFIFPQASAIKIPLLMTIFKQVHEGKFKLSDKRTINPEDRVGGTGVLKSMDGPVTLNIHNISVLMMALSDNTATNVLINLAGMENVNATMKSLGFEKTLLQRKMMHIKASAQGHENLSTPAEAARILKMLYDGKFIDKDVSSDIISFLKKPARRDSRLAAGLPAEVPIAFKPGELSGVSTEWALVLLPERPYAVAIMENYKWGTKQGHAMEAISKILYQYYWRMGNSTRYGVYRDPALMK